MSKVFLLGANVEIDTEIKTVGIGQIIRMEGYEYDNYVVADITHDSYGYSYRLINLRTYEYVTAETIRPLSQKFGIGFYYDDTAPQFFGTDELRAVIHKAEKIADAEIRRKEQEREERQRTKQRGMELSRYYCRIARGRQRPDDRLLRVPQYPNRYTRFFAQDAGGFCRNAPCRRSFSRHGIPGRI